MDNKNNQQKPQQSQTAPQTQQPASGKGKAKSFFELDTKYQVAIEMRLLGTPHSSIAKQITKTGNKVAEDTVRHWFMEGGACYSIYQERKKQGLEELKERTELAKEQMENATMDALAIVRTSIRKALDSGEITEQDYANAKDMLDRGGFPKQTKNENNNINRFDSEGMVAMATAIKSVLEQPKK